MNVKREAAHPTPGSIGARLRRVCAVGACTLAALLPGVGAFGQYDPVFSVQFLSSGSPDSTWVPVTFRFYHPLASSDSGVAVLGGFNGWGNASVSPDAHYDLMADPDGDNWWTATLVLPQGVHEYKFVSLNSLHPRADDGYAHVTNWYSDPLNPEYGGPYQNSILRVSDPMVYYLLPRNGSVVNDPRPELMFNVGASLASDIDTLAVRIFLDGDSAAVEHFQLRPDWGAWVTRPLAELEQGQHALRVHVVNTEGGTAEAVTTFRFSREIFEANYRFLIDTRSPSFHYVGEAQTVSVILEPEDEVPRTIRLEGTGWSGLFGGVVPLRKGKSYDYRVIVDNSTYSIDWDNPVLSLNHKSVAAKQIRPYPRIEVLPPTVTPDFPPLDGAVLSPDELPFELAFRISPSDSGYAIDSSSVQITVDDVPHAFQLTPERILHVRIEDAAEGQHQVRVSAADVRGNLAPPFTYTFGVFPLNSGIWALDARGDADGPGSYRLPTSTAPGACDLRSVHFWGTTEGDSSWLDVEIELDTLDYSTRVLLTAWSDEPVEYAEALPGLELLLPRWEGRGFQVILAHPDAPDLAVGRDNHLLWGREPAQVGAQLPLEAEALERGCFRLRLPIRALVDGLGSPRRPWHWSVVTYVTDGHGEPLEIPPALGGENYTEDPDVYDALFCLDTGMQHRLLGNFIVSWGIGGPRLAKLGTQGRGSLSFQIADLFPDLASSPDVAFLTHGSRWVERSVRVYVRAEAQPGAAVDVLCGQEVVADGVLGPDSLAALVLPLRPGENRFVARLPSDAGTLSEPVVFERVSRDLPHVSIEVSGPGREGFVLNAAGSTDPLGRPLTFHWQADSANPAVSWIDQPNSSTPVCAPPPVPGEYYFNLTVAAEQDTAHGRAVIVVGSDSLARAMDLGLWHPSWVDTMVLYEIYPRSFTPAGTFKAIAGRMGQLAELGITCIWLMPIHPAAMTHGYWVTNYYEVNPEYGTEEDLRALVRTAHSYGIRVILDFVVQHTHFSHAFMRDALRFGRYSPYYSFYLWKPDGGYEYLYGWENLPSVNYADSLAPDYFVEVARHWVREFDIDGYRCDVAWAIDNLREGGAAFWQRLRTALKTLKPDIFLLAEAKTTELNHFDRKFDAAYDRWFFSALKGVFAGSETVSNLVQAIAFHLPTSQEFPSHALPMRFLENHDESRFITLFGPEATRVAATALLTVPGIPLIEYGQEVGETSYRSVVRWSDPHGLRPFYRKLISLRRKTPALRGGTFRDLAKSDLEKTLVFWRHADSSAVLVAANFDNADHTVTVRVPVEELPFEVGGPLFLNNPLDSTSVQVSRGELVNLPLELPALSATVYLVSERPLVTGTAVSDHVVRDFRLWPAYPNPFNPATTINYRIGGDRPVAVKLDVLNVLGQVVQRLVDAPQRPGRYRVVWNGRDSAGEALASGLYFVRLQAGTFRQVQRMLLLR